MNTLLAYLYRKLFVNPARKSLWLTEESHPTLMQHVHQALQAVDGHNPDNTRRTVTIVRLLCDGHTPLVAWLRSTNDGDLGLQQRNMPKIVPLLEMIISEHISTSQPTTEIYVPYLGRPDWEMQTRSDN